eukprot:gb/GECH01008452.1/.p1 GENE.gb/GECH01008452.1/~~gb/GECH01008452.1/.p1  ORF type:complete len:210 (+),score=39.49 gb/GECH01008452.1/:1-630(+)
MRKCAVSDLYNDKRMETECVIDDKINDLSNAMFLIFAGKQSHLSFISLHDTCYHLSLFGDGREIVENIRKALLTAIDRMCIKLVNNTFHQDIADMFENSQKPDFVTLQHWPTFHHSLIIIQQTIINLDRIDGAAHLLYYEGIAQFLDRLVLDKKNRHIYPLWIAQNSRNDLKTFLKTAEHCHKHTEIIHLIKLIQIHLDNNKMNNKDVN